jgi:hypothetical protein
MLFGVTRPTDAVALDLVGLVEVDEVGVGRGLVARARRGGIVDDAAYNGDKDNSDGEEREMKRELCVQVL